MGLPSISEREIEAVVETRAQRLVDHRPQDQGVRGGICPGSRRAPRACGQLRAPPPFILRSRRSASSRMTGCWCRPGHLRRPPRLCVNSERTPVFVDADPSSTLNIDVAKLEERIVELKREHGDKVKAVMPVHIGGQACEMDKIVALAGHHASRSWKTQPMLSRRPPRAQVSPQASASRAWSARSGTRPRSASMPPRRSPPQGGKGSVTHGQRRRMAERVRLMRLHGVQQGRLESRLLAAAVVVLRSACAGLQIQSHRCRVRARHGAIAKRPGAAGPAGGDRPAIHCGVLPDSGAGTARAAPSGRCLCVASYVVRLNLDHSPSTAISLPASLTRAGVGCSVHFIPLHLQPYWRDRYGLTRSCSRGQPAIRARHFPADLSGHERPCRRSRH